MEGYKWRADAFQAMPDAYVYSFLEHEAQAVTGQRWCSPFSCELYDVGYMLLQRFLYGYFGQSPATIPLFQDLDILQYLRPTYL